MPTLEALRGRIDTARDMQSVVAAMKVLSVVSIRQFEQSLASLSLQNRVVELGLQALMQNRPPGIGFIDRAPGARTATLVFGSGQGLSGQFNEQIVAFAREQWSASETPPDQRTILALGDHAGYRLRAAGEQVAAVFPLPGAIDRIAGCVQELFIHLGGLLAGPGLDQISVIYHQRLSGALSRPRALRLFPPDSDWLNGLAQRDWPSRSRPVFTMDWHRLCAGLLQEHMLVSLEQVCAESLLSENASRLIAMQVAERNIGDYLDDLGHKFNGQRQSQITSELLDIVAGSEALFGDEAPEEYGLSWAR
ncbi:MAG: F0F1 ATP synthase subunit gamma [Thermoleophilia bacterium]